MSSKNSENANVCALQETDVTSTRIDVRSEPPANELIFLSFSTFLAFKCSVSESLSPNLQILRHTS